MEDVDEVAGVEETVEHGGFGVPTPAPIAVVEVVPETDVPTAKQSSTVSIGSLDPMVQSLDRGECSDWP